MFPYEVTLELFSLSSHWTNFPVFIYHWLRVKPAEQSRAVFWAAGLIAEGLEEGEERTLNSLPSSAYCDCHGALGIPTL